METHKNLKIGFAGHGRLHNVNDKLKKRLTKAVMKEINDGCLLYTMGTYGDFDNLALTVCKELRQKNTNIEIEVVLTSINQIKNNLNYEGVQTIIYEIENEHYKNRITSSNRQMINSCTTLICYVDMRRLRSGAKKTLIYAKKKGLKIINLYRPDDDPLYLLSEEEKEKKFKDWLKNSSHLLQ